MQEKCVVGLVPSISFKRLKRCIESLSKQFTSFPIIVLAQGYSDSEKGELDNINPGFLRFIHIERLDRPIGYFRSELFKLASELIPEAEYYYLFDDDFIFEENGLLDVLSIANIVAKDPLIGAVYLTDVGSHPFNQGRLYIDVPCNEIGELYCAKEVTYLGMWSGIFLSASAFKDAIGTFDPTITYAEESNMAIHLHVGGYNILMGKVRVKHLYDETSYGIRIHDELFNLSKQGKQRITSNGGICSWISLLRLGLCVMTDNRMHYCLSSKALELRYKNQVKLGKKFGLDASRSLAIPKEMMFDNKIFVFPNDINLIETYEEGFIVLDLDRKFGDPDLEKLPVRLQAFHSIEDKYLVNMHMVIICEFSELRSSKVNA